MISKHLKKNLMNIFNDLIQTLQAINLLVINTIMKQQPDSHTIFQRIILFLSLVLPIAILGCSPSHILHFKKEVSRDYTYVDFVRNDDPFQVTTSVGGEHIKTLKIIGFEGDKFLIEFNNKKGKVNFNIPNRDTVYKRINNYSGTILIHDLDAIVSIETSAHPYAEYSLKITPLALNKKRNGFNLFFWLD